MRPTYGDSFKFNRLINTYFYTSNTDKLLQARIMFVRSGYELRHYTARHEPYDEDYSLGTEGLLTRAISQVSGEFRVRSIFFVEDTSLRIESLSSQDDFPGMRVKEWFAETEFEDLDRLIAGRSREAVVKSDIALHIPTLSRPLLFHGETRGIVAATPPEFLANEQYPWLTPDTFNGWFIPHGSDRRLGEMEIEESLDFDFRARSLTSLITRIEELNGAVNLRPQQYTSLQVDTAGRDQPSLFSESGKKVIIVTGHKCAGKTTLSDYVGGKGDVRVIEASSVLRTIAAENGYEISNSSEALAFLTDHGLEVVASRICDYIENSEGLTTIVTGLRTIEELLEIRLRFPESRILNVSADPRIRFERHIRRARDKNVRTYAEFQRMDEEQRRFGIMRVAEEICTYEIPNDLNL